MGGADIKLNAVYGAILGLKLSVLSLFIAFIVGALISALLILFRIKGRKDVIPFSPFLSIGALTSFAFGGIIINMYLGLLKG
jgi:leader peptidase (prepilin peptidase) / N-methyltransferase